MLMVGWVVDIDFYPLVNGNIIYGGARYGKSCCFTERKQT